MTYTPPIAEQRFVLETIVVIGDLGVDSDIIDAILEGAGAFAAGEFAPLNRIGDTVGAKWADGKVTMPEGFAAAWRAYVEGGWGSLDGPEEFGGQGLPFCLATVVLENLGSANMAFTLCPMLTVGAIEAIHAHGTDDQRAAYLPRLISGEWTGTMNLTEPQAGSDVGALRTTAMPNGDGSYSIAGTKIFITFGDHDLAGNIVHLVLARTPGAPAGTRGISLFLVPKFRPDEGGAFTVPNDVRCLSIEHKLGIHASPTCVMSYGDAGDCKGWLIGPETGGIRAMFTMMNNARLNVGLQGVQIGERATQAAVAHARDRIQGGGPIIEHPDVRRMLMRMKALTQGARALIYAAAGNVDRAKRGDADAKARVDLLTPLAKAYGTDVGCEVASLGVQVHGGMGFVEETGAAQNYRDIRIAPIYEGTNGIQAADLVGRKLGLEGGAAVAALLADIRRDAGGEGPLPRLADAIEAAVAWMRDAPPQDRLAGSYPLLDMMAVATSGALLARQARIAAERLAAGEGDPAFLKAKGAVARYYLDQLVPEALGKAAAATAGAASLYALDAAELAA
ncbi:MAG: acyl-CoA dehydrogenase [Sphingomonadaceae bacterium]|nr:acyl-CoA dehydrogenase [Sphingomonadaceae bacterium]